MLNIIYIYTVRLGAAGVESWYVALYLLRQLAKISKIREERMADSFDRFLQDIGSSTLIKIY